MKKHPGWPHTLEDAIAAEIVPWASRGIGVCYTFPGNDQQSNPIGTEDRATLACLERAGKVSLSRRRHSPPIRPTITIGIVVVALPAMDLAAVERR